MRSVWKRNGKNWLKNPSKKSLLTLTKAFQAVFFYLFAAGNWKIPRGFPPGVKTASADKRKGYVSQVQPLSEPSTQQHSPHLTQRNKPSAHQFENRTIELLSNQMHCCKETHGDLNSSLRITTKLPPATWEHSEGPDICILSRRLIMKAKFSSQKTA